LRAHSEVTWAQGCTVNWQFDVCLSSQWQEKKQSEREKREVNPFVVIPPKEIAGKASWSVFIMHKEGVLNCPNNPAQFH
jgi:hypothetical protein